MSKNFIQIKKSELKHAKKVAKMYRDLYHGTMPHGKISIYKKDWDNVVNELKQLRKLQELVKETIKYDLELQKEIGGDCVVEGLKELQSLVEKSKEIKDIKFPEISLEEMNIKADNMTKEFMCPHCGTEVDDTKEHYMSKIHPGRIGFYIVKTG